MTGADYSTLAKESNTELGKLGFSRTTLDTKIRVLHEGGNVLPAKHEGTLPSVRVSPAKSAAKS